MAQGDGTRPPAIFTPPEWHPLHLIAFLIVENGRRTVRINFDFEEVEVEDGSDKALHRAIIKAIATDSEYIERLHAACLGLPDEKVNSEWVDCSQESYFD